ncbi:MAG: ABC transporter ATP-binding protein [Lentisphaeria bacterium]|nr:ABC transporter ATP-binding protein [Lentisphaeria bacterium]
MKKLKTIWQLTEGGRVFYFVAVLSLVISVVVGYFIPIVIQYSIDTVIGGEVVNSNFMTRWLSDFLQHLSTRKHVLFICSILVVIFSLIQGFFNFIRGRFASKSAQNSARLLKNRLFNHIQHLPSSYYNKINTGDLVQRCSSDVETYSLFIEQQSIEFFRVVIMIIAVIPIMLSYNLKMTLAAMCLLPIIILYSFYYFFCMKRIHQAVAESEAEMSTVVQENLTGVRVVKAFAQQGYEVEKFKTKNSDFKANSLEMIKIVANYWAISAFFCMLQIGIVLVYGVISASRGELSIGEFTLFISLEVALVWIIRGMGRILGEMGKAMVSFNRINEILDEETESSNGKSCANSRGSIEFRDVSFSYPDSESEVLKNLSFEIESGATVAFVGPTGAGKSSLINLIPRLFDPTSGEIRIDGVNSTEFNRQSLRSKIGFVTQEPFLYSKSIKENIANGASVDVTFDQIQHAAKTANIHQDIMAFGQGYETLVGERGVTLSGGQKQRVAIARAIIGNHPILIFDDSLSAIDAQTDQKIRKNLSRNRGTSTQIITSHRMSTVCEADCIYVLDHGRIVESGSHQVLIAQQGMYSRLWKLQKVD